MHNRQISTARGFVNTLVLSISTARVDNCFIFPVVYMENGSRDQSCQHLWFSEFDFFHHVIENKVIFYNICHSYIGLSQFCKKEKAEHNVGIIGANTLVYYISYASNIV